MQDDDPFPPVDPVTSSAPASIVGARRRRFTQYSRYLFNLLNHERRELDEYSNGGGNKPKIQEPSPEPPENLTGFDRTV